MALTLAQLLETPTEDQIRAQVLAALNSRDFPITDWHSGGAGRTMQEAWSRVLNDLVGKLVPLIAGGGFADLATGEWLPFLAFRRYGIERREASYTFVNLTLMALPGVGPITKQAGDLVALSAAGNRYILDEGGTIPQGGEVILRFKAESPGASYNDGPGSIVRLITALPGVSVENRATDFSEVLKQGQGTGSISLAIGSPTEKTWTIRIATTGAVNVATFDYSLDGGPFVAGGTCLSGGIEVGPATVTFIAGASPPHFVVGDTFQFTSPGSPTVAQGMDQETPAELVRRMKARWPALSEVPLADTYETWAHEASLEVTKVTVRPDNTAATPGRVVVTIAGNAPLGGTVVSTVTNYIDQRAGVTDHPVVVAATEIPIEGQGTVVVEASKKAAVQARAQQLWQDYLAAAPIGGRLRASELAQALMDAGAIDYSGLLVGPTGTGPFTSVHSLDDDEVATPSSTLSNTMFWVNGTP